MLASFEPIEALRHVQFMNSEATIILNTRPVVPVGVSAQKVSYPDIAEVIDTLGRSYRSVLSFDATSLADECGNPIAMNVVMLGAICGSGALSLPEDVLREAIEDRSPSHLHDINMDAFKKGFEHIGKLK